MPETRPSDGSPYVSHSCEDTQLAVYERESCCRLIRASRNFSGLTQHTTFLDVGCGSSPDGLVVAGRAQYLGIDSDPECGNPDRGSGYRRYRTLPWQGLHTMEERFDVVFTKRMLCQVPEKDHRTALAAMWERVRPGGLLVVCGPVRQRREAFSERRVALGLSPLGEPASGGHCRDQYVVQDLAPHAWVSQEVVAAQYVLWTRLTYELLIGRQCPYDEPQARRPLLAGSLGAASEAFYIAEAVGKPR